MKKFQYTKRDAEDVQKRIDQAGGVFDNPFKEGLPVFLPKLGDHTIRILPPTWPGAKHYGHDVYLHSQIGADNGRFVCPKIHAGKVCPICVEMEAARRAGDGEYAYKLKAKKRVAVWIIVRGNEKAGPMLYPMPWMFDRAISAVSVDKRTREVYYLDHPDEGYDVDFSLIKDAQYTKETGIAIARRATPISDDEEQQTKWLEYITEHQIPDCLLIRDSEYITKILAGAGKPKEDGEDEDPTEASAPVTRESRRKAVDEEEEQPRRKPRVEEEEAEEEQPVAKKKAAVIEDDSQELDEAPKSVKKKVTPPPDEDEEPVVRKRPAPVEEDEEEAPVPVKKRPAPVEEEEDVPPPKKRPAPVEDDGETTLPPKKKVVVAAVDEEEEDTPVRPGPLKARRPVAPDEDE